MFDRRYQMDLIQEYPDHFLSFIAPECQRMDERRIDRRADIFSLGTLLAFLCKKCRDIDHEREQALKDLANQCRSETRTPRPDSVSELLRRLNEIQP